MIYPEYAEINGKLYKINTDFRYAIKCDEIAKDNEIGDFERSLAIIYTLFGDEGLKNSDDYSELLRISQKFLLCNEEYDNKSNEKPDMDYIQDMDYIEASFMSDYHIDLTNIEMHWWKFQNLMNGLSNSELGNCCVLNRVRNLRNANPNEIKDKKERDKIIKAQKQVALKVEKKKPTKKEVESASNLLKQLGIGRK
jgi:hypothetical protein